MGKQWARKEAKSNELATAMESVALWLKFHPQVALWGGIGILLAVFIGAALINRSKTVAEESWSKFAIAQSYAYSGRPDEAIGLVNSLSAEYPSSAAAGFAGLMAGDILYQQAKYAEAAAAYQKVVDSPNHRSLIPIATAGLGLSEEAKGDCKRAADIAQGFLSAFQDHFLAPQVHASVARCLSATGETEKAKATYERMGFLYPNTYWAEWAAAHKG